MAVDLPKPRYAAPCNGCGLCCKLELCHIAEEALDDMGIDYQQTSGPCPFLIDDGKRHWCKIVKTEADAKALMPSVDPIIAKSLRIGWGCTMDDEEGNAA